MMSSLLRTCIIWAALLGCSGDSRAHPGDLFRVFDLEYTGSLLLYHVEDINGDGLKDALIMTDISRSSSTVRCLSLYLQDENGFARKPNQTLELDKTIILFDLGDVAGDAQKELVCLKKDGVSFYPFGETGFILTPRRLFNTDSAFMVAGQPPVKWDLVADVNGDYVEELLVPKMSRMDIYFRTAGNNWLINELPIRMEARVSGMYDPRFSVGNYAEAVYTTPFLLTEDFDADGRNDLLAVYKDSLLVFCQEENGYFAQKCRQNVPLHFGDVWRGEKIQRTRIADKSERFYLMRIKDLNHDGLVDAVGIRISTVESVVNPATEVRIYFGKRDTLNSQRDVFFAEAPDQIIQPDGTQLVLDIFDLNQDQKYDLIIPVIKVGLQNIVKMLLTRSIEIRAEIYLLGDNGYPRKPDTEIRMTVKFSYRGGATSPVYEVADFDGDGFHDILTSISEKTLAIFSGNDKKGISDRMGPKFNVHLPQNGELVRTMDLNSDRRSDVVIMYNEDNPLHQDLTHILRMLLAN